MDPSNAVECCNRLSSKVDDKSHPRSVTLTRDKSGFGFTLRHFIVYPPTGPGKTKQGVNEESIAVGAAPWQSDYKNKPMDTIFIREVKEGSPAHTASLNKGDRIIAINGHPLSGKSYSDIIHLILKSGQTLRLLVVPKEDDILQLYFASSAYQPVHRDTKQRKYLVPSYHPHAEQSNQMYIQSAYGTYPGRMHKKVKSAVKSPEISHESNFSSESNAKSPAHISSNPVTSPSYDVKSPGKTAYGCFSDDEAIYQPSSEFGTNDLQSPELKDTVANLYYDLCHNPSGGNFSFSSEENLNYPIYMSDFDDIVHCDNMTETQAVPDPSRSARVNHCCDKSHDTNCLCLSGVHPYWKEDKDLISSGAMYQKAGERNSIASPYGMAENSSVPSINVVAQRRHQFESGSMLAESLDKMDLYRSELSRMSKPNHVHMVSSRTAEFENKYQSAVASTFQKSIHKKEEFLNQPTHLVKDVFTSSMSKLNSCLDLENSNKAKTITLNNAEDAEKSSDPEFNAASVVHRRKTVPVSSDQDECHIVRRISYLRATAGERMNVESDLSEEETSEASSPNKDIRVQKLKTFFGEKTPQVKQALVPDDSVEMNGSSTKESNEEPKCVYGWVICKVVSLEGKRSSDRSWRHLWAVLRDNNLYLLKERREPSKGAISGDEHVINVKYSISKPANDYVKRKHVFRLMLLNGTEYLFQTESHASMMEWLKALQMFTKEISQLPEWLKNTSVLEKAAAYEQQIHKVKTPGQHHNVRKLVFRHRGPSDHSPTIKTRRASQGDELALTKIGVLWKDRMVQGWKKVHGTNPQIPKGASFGVKLENAPPGVTNEHIPLLVELCIQIVETRGLDTVGIYRVPGNNASVSVLTDSVNQGIDDELLKDTRWNDVNIVSSLLKAFFRKLPEPLLTSSLYPKFIQASEVDDSVKRLKAIKQVLHHLPAHYFATLKYLMYHLKKVVEHSETNKMEARNLAIVFGPTLVRATDNNMVAMVTDMPQQCYLIETMITYAEWLFEDCGDILPIEVNAQDKRKTHPPTTMQSSALLSNLNRLDEESLPHEMFSTICNAASKHLRHRPKKKDPTSYAKKRSGIIADDTDILAGVASDFAAFEKLGSKSMMSEAGVSLEKSMEVDVGMELGFKPIDAESDVSFESSSSLTNAGIKNGALCEEGDKDPNHSESSDLIGHRYDKRSVLAQEKIRNFEEETKALLRRDGQKAPRPPTTTPQVEWEQIEKEWQKAKLELEEEDVLDFVADDPSYLSCLLSRGSDSIDQPRSLDFDLRSAIGKASIPSSSSSSSVQEITNFPITHRFSPNLSTSALLHSHANSLDNATRSPYTSLHRSRLEKSSDIPTSISQPALATTLMKPPGEEFSDSLPEIPNSSRISDAAKSS